MLFLKKIKFDIKLAAILYPGLIAWAVAQIILLGYGIYMSYEAYQLAVTHINKEILDNAAAYSTCQHDVTNVAEKITEARRISADVHAIDVQLIDIVNRTNIILKQDFVGSNAAKELLASLNEMTALENQCDILVNKKTAIFNNTNYVAVEPLVQKHANLVANEGLLKEKASMLLEDKQELKKMPFLPQDKISQGIIFKAPIIVGVSVCVGLAIFSMAGGSEPPTSA
jgi:hypothetical protein